MGLSLDWWIFLVVKTMRRDIDREERRSRGREKKRLGRWMGEGDGT